MNRIAIVLVLGSAASLLSATPSLARDVFVNNLSGDDHWNGDTALSQVGMGPLRSIQQALHVANAGDRIVLANTGTPYREMISLSTGNNSGSSVMPFVIDGQGAVLDGSWPVATDGWESYRGPVFRFRPPRMAYQQLFRDGRPLVRRVAPMGFNRPPELKPLEWALVSGWIYFRAENGKLPDDYDLSYAALQTGITLYHVHDVIITNLIVQGFQLDGINAHDGVRDCRLLNVVTRGNGRAGITVAGSSELEIIGSLSGDNGRMQLYAEGLGLASVQDSELLENPAPPVVRHGGTVMIDGRVVDGERD